MPRASQTGFFITFEGSEGCGKSTQIRRLAESLQSAGCEPILVREPGGTAIGEQIRHLLQHSKEGLAMAPETELLLFAASRAQLVREIIQPSLAAGRVVISDRFLDSTTVYQGVARRLQAGEVAPINAFAAGTRPPDVTFLLDMDAEEAMKRLRGRIDAPKKFDRMEELPLEFYQNVRQGYLELAAAEPGRFRVLDATKSQDDLAAKIFEEFQRRAHGHLQGIRV